MVRIGDSPFAPIFEVVEKPNDWERRIREKERSAKQPDPNSDDRYAFWSALGKAHPEIERHGSIAYRTWNAWVQLWDDPKIILSLFVGKDVCGCFLRGARGANPQLLDDALGAHADRIIAATGATHWGGGNTGHYAVARLQKSYLDPANWPDMIAWMAEEHDRYRAVVEKIMRGEDRP